jgi:lysophospholipase L1-like esterase
MTRFLPACLATLVFAATLSAVAQAPDAPDSATPPAAPRTAVRTPAPPIVPTVIPPALTGPVTYTCGPAKAGATALTPAALVTGTAAGWDLKSVPTIAKGVCSSTGTDKPFYFSIPLPEGNYRVTVALGGKEASVVTVRAEARRLYIEKLPVKAGSSITKTFDVNLRIPEFTKPDGTPGRVRLKPREIGNLDWDPKLTLEFNGVNPSVSSIKIEPITGEPVLYLAGDSTMVDQDVEPWASWGQMLPRFFLPGIVIANHAESGEASNSFVAEQRFAKIMSEIKPGDWFFVQFAHNDQKNKDFLPKYHEIMTDFVNQVRAKGANPVIVTAMNRDSFDDQGHIRDTFAGYIQAAREVATATKAPLIDLNYMSKTMFEAMGPGPDKVDHAFMHFAANTFPDQPKAIHDDTHFNNYGAYELARCIVHGIREDNLPIAKFIDPSVPDFNPAKPDPFTSFHLPFTPMQTKEDTTKIPQANL